VSNKGQGGNIPLFVRHEEERDMRIKGVVRTKTLKKLVEDGHVQSISAIETKEGVYHLLVKDINGEESFLTTYRGRENRRSFTTLDAFWTYCKSIGVKQIRVFST
jgi:hypothetical protein